MRNNEVIDVQPEEPVVINNRGNSPDTRYTKQAPRSVNPIFLGEKIRDSKTIYIFGLILIILLSFAISGFDLQRGAILKRSII